MFVVVLIVADANGVKHEINCGTCENYVYGKYACDKFVCDASKDMSMLLKNNLRSIDVELRYKDGKPTYSRFVCSVNNDLTEFDVDSNAVHLYDVQPSNGQLSTVVDWVFNRSSYCLTTFIVDKKITTFVTSGSIKWTRNMESYKFEKNLSLGRHQFGKKMDASSDVELNISAIHTINVDSFLKKIGYPFLLGFRRELTELPMLNQILRTNEIKI